MNTQLYRDAVKKQKIGNEVTEAENKAALPRAFMICCRTAQQTIDLPTKKQLTM